MHIGIGTAANRDIVVPKLLEWLARDGPQDYTLEYEDGIGLLPTYEKAWWEEEVPEPVPILVVQELAWEHQVMVGSLVSTCFV